MNDYLTGMIARSEHELMKQSLAPVSDFGEHSQNRQSGWAARHIGKLFQAVGSALTSVGERMSREQHIPRGNPLSDNC